MGINDRDYGRYGNGDQYGYNDQPGFHLGGSMTMTVKLVIANVIVYVIQLLNRGSDPRVSSWFDQLFALREDWYLEPWRIYEFLSYGFLHDPWSMWHIVGNMFVLWMFGRYVEERLGAKEFLALYLCSIVFAAVVWNISELFWPENAAMRGASGGVSAILLLFIFYYPHVKLLFMFVLPMPAWVLGVIIVGSDLFGAIGRSGEVAFTAHLGGFLFAYLYYKWGIRLTDYLPNSLPSFKRKPALKVHRPSDDERKEQRLDDLLEKVAKGGQESLSGSEKRELQKLSKYYQDKRRE